MQIHTPSLMVHDNGDFVVTLAGSTPFAIIELDKYGETRIVIENPDDADRLIRAVVAAKMAITGARALLAPMPDEPTGAHCGAPHPATEICEFTCTRRKGHPDDHEAQGPDGEIYANWPQS